MVLVIEALHPWLADREDPPCPYVAIPCPSTSTSGIRRVTLPGGVSWLTIIFRIILDYFCWVYAGTWSLSVQSCFQIFKHLCFVRLFSSVVVLVLPLENLRGCHLRSVWGCDILLFVHISNYSITSINSCLSNYVIIFCCLFYDYYIFLL